MGCFKLIVLSLAAYVVYDYLNTIQIKFSEFWSLLQNTHIFNIGVMVILLCLSIINWLLECRKWQVLASRVGFISFSQAIIQTLSSQTSTLITPMRVGEYGIKAIYAAPGKRSQIITLNFLGNMGQMTATVFFGILGSTWLIKLSYRKDIVWILIGSLLVILLFTGIYLYLKYNKSVFFSLEKLLTKQLVKTVLNLSFFRYLVFSHQFYLLLCLLGAPLTYLDSMALITTTYLISSMLPVFSIFDVAVKGGIALVLFTDFGCSAITILSVTTIMWLINIALPSLIGGYFFLRMKLLKQPSAIILNP